MSNADAHRRSNSCTGYKRRHCLDDQTDGPQKSRKAELPFIRSCPVRVDDLEIDQSDNDMVANLQTVGLLLQELTRDAGLANLVSEMMLRNRRNVVRQVIGMRLLSEFGRDQDAGMHIQSIAEAMKSNPDSIVIQIEGCTALRRQITQGGGSVELLPKEESLYVVMDAINRHASQQLRFLGLDVVRLLVANSREHRKAVASNETIVTMVLQLVEASSADSSSTQVGLSLVSWIVEELEGRKLVDRKGGILLVLSAMESHPGDSLVQCNAAACLCWLIHTKSVQARSSFASGSKGIDLVIRSLKQQVDCPSVFGNIICILIVVLITDPSRQDIQNSETAEIAVRGLEQHIKVPKVRRNCLNLLRLITTDDHSCQTIVVENIKLIQLAMQEATNIEDTHAQADACVILADVCLVEGGRSKLLKSGCVETVVTSQLQHRPCLRLQHAAALFHSVLLEPQRSSFGDGVNVFDTMFAETNSMQN